MLATSKTTTTWMLSVLSYTTVTGGHMAAAKIPSVSFGSQKQYLVIRRVNDGA